MTNKEKVDKFFDEIESIFGTRESVLAYLDNYDSLDKESQEKLQMVTLGKHQKTTK